MSITDVIFCRLESGDYRGQRIADVMITDEGLLYLEYQFSQVWCSGFDKIRLEIFLQDKGIYYELEKLRDEGKHRRFVEELENAKQRAETQGGSESQG